MTLLRSIVSDALSASSIARIQENSDAKLCNPGQTKPTLLETIARNTAPVIIDTPYQQLLRLEQPMDRPRDISSCCCCPKVRQGLRGWGLPCKVVEGPLDPWWSLKDVGPHPSSRISIGELRTTDRPRCVLFRPKQDGGLMGRSLGFSFWTCLFSKLSDIESLIWTL